ncbi:hypothetical protein EVA_18396 [gut metagenome]|uniref:Uncharacterized protein n=1 Tax=gut metagenome TaxID=749906 RepID=J9FF08_9ZZZZ
MTHFEWFILIDKVFQAGTCSWSIKSGLHIVAFFGICTHAHSCTNSGVGFKKTI